MSGYDWATTTNNLAAAYYRVNGNKADNIEQAIKLFKTALEIRTRNNYPQEWAETNNNLGEAYRQRIREEVRGENIEQAITFYNAALEVYTRDGFRERWAETKNNLGEAYVKESEESGKKISSRQSHFTMLLWKFTPAMPFPKIGQQRKII